MSSVAAGSSTGAAASPAGAGAATAGIAATAGAGAPAASGVPVVTSVGTAPASGTARVGGAAGAPTGRAARRAHSDSVAAAFDQAVEPHSGDVTRPAHGVSTVEDLAEVRRVFADVAAIHVAQVRDVMLELRYGDAQPTWIESTQPTLRSLRAMAAQMDLTDLCLALDDFCVAVDAVTGGRPRIDDDARAELLRRYQRLIDLMPQAFELDAERDRREPLIVEALLYQTEGVEKRTVDKLFAVGLNRLEILVQASAAEIAVTAGLRAEVAEAIVAQFKAYRHGASAALSAPDPLAERRQLGDLLIMLSVKNDEYCHAGTKWTDEAKARKQEARKQRDQAFQRIKVALARLGDRDLLVRLEKLPFHERIATLDRYLSAAIPTRSPPGKP